MNEQTTNNDNLINEYINVLAKKYNDVCMEMVTVQARVNLVVKEKEISEKQHNEIFSEKVMELDSLQAELVTQRELYEKNEEMLQLKIDNLTTENKKLKENTSKTPVKETVKEVEVVKEVIKDEKLVRENEALKKEIFNLERKLKKVKERQEEIADGGNT